MSYNRIMFLAISNEAIEKARSLGYDEQTLKSHELSKNSLEVEDCVEHRGVYEWLYKRGVKMDDNYFKANCEIIHHFNNNPGGSSEKFINFQKHVKQKHNIPDLVGAPPTSAYYGITHTQKEMRKNPIEFREKYMKSSNNGNLYGSDGRQYMGYSKNPMVHN